MILKMMMMMLAVILNLILNFDNLMMMIILIHKKDGDFLTWKTFAMICEDLRASFHVVSTACCYVNNYWRRPLSLRTSWNALAKLQRRISPCPSSFRDYTSIIVHHHLDFLVRPQKYLGGQRLFCRCCFQCCCCYWPLIIVGPL